MKKLITVMLCLGIMLPIFAQKANVDKAEKLVGKEGQLATARGYLKEAMNDPETKNQARTYFVAGKAELEAYKNGIKNRMINPNDPSAQPVVMADELLNGYRYFLMALPLDSLPNEKGQIKPKYSKEILNQLKGYAQDFFNAGADYFNEKLYYPQAYDAFMIYGDLPSTLFKGDASVVEPSQVATAYFNAGLAAYSGNNLEASANAFRKAREAGNEQPEAYIYEIACWQNIAQNDESRSEEAQKKIYEIAQAGNEKFGMDQPLFLNNMINFLVNEEKMDQAISELNSLIAQNPNTPNLYGLRGFVYDRMGNDDLSEADYRKAASMDGADFETIKNASKKLYRVGTQKLNDIEGSSEEAAAQRENVRKNYFLQAQDYAKKADQMQPGDPEVQSILDSIDYSITTYFPAGN